MFKNKKIQSNIWKYYLYRLFGSAIFTMPIWVLYMQENGLSLTEIMILQSVYTIVTLIASVPFGALADRWGRKYVLIISQLLNIFGYFIYIFSTSFWTFFAGEIIFGLSTATFFGVGEAFVYDSLKATKHVNKYKKVQGNVYAINDFVMGITGMFGAAIAAVLSMRFTYGLSILPLTIALFVIFSFKEPKHEKPLYIFEKYEPRKIGYFRHIKETLIFTLTHPQLKFIILFSMLIGSFAFMTFFFNQVYFTEVGISLKYIGILYAIMFSFSAFGAKSCHYVEEKLKEKWTSILIVSLFFIFLLICSLTKTWIGIPFALAIWLVASGLRGTFVSDFINKHAQSHHRATVMSINIIIGNIFFALISPVFGVIADNKGTQSVFLIMGIVLAFYLVWLLWFFRRR